jgi:hypothetical protein
MKTLLTILTLLASLLPRAAHAQPMADARVEAVILAPEPAPNRMSSPVVDLAVAVGIRNKNANHALVLRDSGQGFANVMAIMAASRYSTPATKSGLWLEVYTPLSWVSQQAAIATREYRQFVVAPDMLDPIVRVYAHPDTPDIVSARGAAGTRSVQHVVMQNHRRSITVQPLGSEDFVVETKNAMGGSLTYTGQEVTFAFDDVLRLFSEGEFDIIVVGTNGEKRFTVKAKHFKRLPM